MNQKVHRALGEICQVGGVKPAPFEGERPYYSTGAIGVREFLREPKKTRFQGRPSRANSMPPVGSVGFAKIKGTKKLIMISNELEGAIFSTGFCFLVPGPDVLSEYLAYYFESDQFNTAKDNVSGDGIMGVIKDRDVRNLELYLPSLSEQKKIITILNEVSSAIAVAVTNAKKNLANESELFSSRLNRIFSNNDYEWEETTLGECLNVQPRNGWSPPAAHHSDSGIPVLTLSSVTGFQFKGDKVKYTSALTDPDRHYWVKDGDFLITRSNTTELVGHVAIANGINEPTIYPDLIMRMNPDEQRLLTEFLYYQMRTNRLRDEIKSRAKGANPTMKKINKKSVQTLPIFLAPLEIQQNIVIDLDKFTEETKHFEAIYLQKTTSLIELKQSILQKAFTGNLSSESDRNLKEVGL